MAIGIHHSGIARISGLRQPIGDRQLFVTVSMTFEMLVLLAILGIAEAVDQLQTQTDDDNLEHIVSDHKAQWVSIAEHIKDLEEILKTQKDLSKRLQLLTGTETRHERSNQQQCLGCERNRMYPWAEQPGPFQFQANCTHVGAHNSALNFNFEVCTMVFGRFYMLHVLKVCH